MKCSVASLGGTHFSLSSYGTTAIIVNHFGQKSHQAVNIGCPDKVYEKKLRGEREGRQGERVGEGDTRFAGVGPVTRCCFQRSLWSGFC